MDTKFKRKVFGRRKVIVDGTDYTIEMRLDGLFVRPKWARRGVVVDFQTLVDNSLGQIKLL